MNCIRRNYYYYTYIWFIIIFASIYLITFYVAVGNDNSLHAIAFYCLMFGIGGMFFAVTSCCYYKRFHYSQYGQTRQNTQVILPTANTEILPYAVYTQELLQPFDTIIKNEELPVALQIV